MSNFQIRIRPQDPHGTADILVRTRARDFGPANIHTAPFIDDLPAITPLQRKFDEVSYLAKLFEPKLEEAENLWRYWLRETLSSSLQEKEPSGALFYEINFSGIKELNEHLWSTTGTEAYLEHIHRHLHDTLFDNFNLGAVLQTTYKSNIAVSELKPDEFMSKVFDPLRRSIYDFLRDRVPPPVNSSWKDWICEHCSLAYGTDLLKAHYWSQRKSAYRWGEDSIATAENKKRSVWRKEACLLRRGLVFASESLCRENGMNWNDLISVAQIFLGRNQGGPEGLRDWLCSRGSEELAAPLVKYFQMLQMAHFFPFRAPPIHKIPTVEDILRGRRRHPLFGPTLTWECERAISFQLGRNARHVAIVDIAKFGRMSRLAQDKWMAGTSRKSGANFSELPHVYDHTTMARDHLFHNLVNNFRHDLGPKFLSIYRNGGDEASFFFDDLNSTEIRKVDKVLSKLQALPEQPNKRVHYFGKSRARLPLAIHTSGLVEVDASKVPESLAIALIRARELLKMALPTELRRSRKLQN